MIKHNLHKNQYPKFMFGAEFECGIDREYEETIRQDIHSINPDITFGTDGSLRFVKAFKAIEIRTPVLPLTKGIELFEQLINYFTLLTEAGLFRTNHTCGLHLNFSEKQMFKPKEWQLFNTFEMVPHAEPKCIRFYCNILSLFDEDQITKLFKREYNDYAIRLGTFKKNEKSILCQYNRGCYQYKYQTVALRPIQIYFPDGRRITNQFRVEFRCLGNKNYQIKHKELQESLDHIQNCLSTAYQKCV